MPKTLIFLLLLIPSLSWGLTFKDGKQINSNSNMTSSDEYLIKKPGIIFIENKQLKNNLQKSKNIKKACLNENQIKLDDINLKVNKSLRGSSVGDEITDKISPLLKTYCNFLISEINQEINKSNEIKDELINFYIKLAKSNYLLDWHKDSNDSDHAYNISVSIVPIIFVYAQIKDFFDENESNNIEKMFTDIVKKNEYIFSPELVWEDSRYNNHAYYTNNVRMLVAIVLNNSKMFNQSISYFLTQMKFNETKSGLFKYESKRGECALHYNLHTLSPIMSTLWNLNLQGVDFTKVNLNNTQTIDDIISVMIDAYTNPMIVINENKRLGYNQEGRDTCGLSDTIKLEELEGYKLYVPDDNVMWFAPYFSLTNNQEIKNKFTESPISKEYYYNGTSDSSIISYFAPFIYVDNKTGEEIKFLNEISLKLNETRYDYDIINFDQYNYEIEWTLEEVGNLDSKKIIAKDLLTFDSNIGSIIEFGDDEYLSKDIRTKFNYEFVDRIINISGNFEIEGFENKEILLQLLNSGEIFKGEKRLNDKKGIAHKIKVKIKKI